ncbi:acyltransferase family protein [Octadecabacter ascidiaceicola]|uniref:Acyltransferase family protein n=1 Tax=Octadecabacter ascidiaceicola TaxID=1655543 RepID=A0A238KBQ4_9RHOB|nr:acyltransferase [Octadecabacter ascidiaceicola]SMX39632.1 Acyltransferase family protein [Octadecabacter ascidiaceicola]
MPFNKSQDPAIPTYFGWIDALRGLAAICIAVFHYTRFYMPSADVPVIPVAVEDVPYTAFLWPVYLYGEEAVRLFWVISGFVFAHVYWSRNTDFRQFAVARFARLYPLHFVTLIIVAALQIISLTGTGHWQIVGNNDLKHFFLQVFMLDTSLSLSDGNSFNAPIWSVSAEVFVYILFFATLPLTKRNPVIMSLLLSAIAYAALTVRPDAFIIGQWVFVCTVFFFAGSACFAAFRAFGGRSSRVGLLLAGLLVLGWLGFENQQHNVLLITICCSVVLAMALLESHFTKTANVMRFLGDISYSLYLVHIPIQIFVLLVADMVFDGDRSFAATYWALPVFLAASIGTAYLTNRYFEKPAARWLRRRFAKR